ncbi:MAG: hypothetical protein CMIDDMOC_00543 [Sodalis sp. Fle]|nr:MAG: hypothetical protein CMIDDMOC_00543 [Sodalis sp. Fle]
MDKDKNYFRGILSLNAPAALGHRPCIINTFYTSEYVDRRRVPRGEITARAIVYPPLATLKDQHTL